MNKRIKYFLFSTIFITSVYSQTRYSTNKKINLKFDINGEISDGAINGLKIYLVNNISNDTIGNCIIKNNHFSFKGDLQTTPEWYSIQLEGLDLNKNPVYFIENCKMKIKGSFSDWAHAKMYGSRSNDDLDKFQELTNPIYKRYYDLGDAIGKVYGETIVDTLKGKRLLREQQRVADTLSLVRIKFIEMHPNSTYTPWLILHTGALDYPKNKTEYDKLATSVKGSNYGIQLRNETERAKIRMAIKIGNIAPDFTSFTPNGDSLSLKDVVAKSRLTLIDFWASWCGPCREETPNFRKIYQAFHSKGFNILSVSADSKEKNWKDAIVKDSMDWYQVSQLRGTNEEAMLLYGINGIPACILLDAEGRIIDIDAVGAEIGEGGKDNFNDKGNLKGEALYKKVEDILDAPKNIISNKSSN